MNTRQQSANDDEIPECDEMATYKDLAAVYMNKPMFYKNLKKDPIQKVIESMEKFKEVARQ